MDPLITGGPQNHQPEGVPEFQVTAPIGGVGTRPPEKLLPPTPMGNHPLMDWGVWPMDNDDTGKSDYKVASWTIEQIKNAPNDQPFFISTSFVDSQVGRLLDALDEAVIAEHKRWLPKPDVPPAPGSDSRILTHD